MMNLLCLLAICWLAGCEHSKPAPSSMVVHPGIGIPGILTNGITIAAIKKATGDTKTHTNSVSVFFPSIGARYDCGILNMPADNEPCNGAILFVISLPDYPDLHFVGSVHGGPSFGNGPVKREQIIASFGEPTTHIQSGPYPLMCTREDIVYQRCMQTETNFSQRYQSGITNGPFDSEVLRYRGKGIIFWLKDDSVTALCVHEPWIGGTICANEVLEKKDMSDH